MLEAFKYFFKGIIVIILPLAGLTAVVDQYEDVIWVSKTNHTPHITPSGVVPPERSAIIYLTDRKHNFFCSGFVISDEYAITASHCVQRSLKILVDESTPATVVGYNRRVDYALIEGNFLKYDKLPVDLVSPRFPGLKGKTAVACGYPEGQHVIACTPQKIIGPRGFAIATHGELHPGMSGGPLIYTEGSIVVAIGVNQSVGGQDEREEELFDLSYFSSLLGFGGNLKIE